jgi:hypothetical protein
VAPEVRQYLEGDNPLMVETFPQGHAGLEMDRRVPARSRAQSDVRGSLRPILLTNRFRAFGETMDPDDILGNEFTDCYLNEWPTLPEELCSALVDRVGREPPRE